MVIFGIENFDGKHISLKKYKFKESALIIDKGRSRKIKRYEDLHPYLVCTFMNSEMIITVPEDYEYSYHSTRNLEINRVQGVH